MVVHSDTERISIYIMAIPISRNLWLEWLKDFDIPMPMSLLLPCSIDTLLSYRCFATRLRLENNLYSFTFFVKQMSLYIGLLYISNQ